MKTTFKKTLSLALVLVMVFATMMIVPLTTSAADAASNTAALTGSGTEADPWIIDSAEDLQALCPDPDNGAQLTGDGSTLYLKLACDIDMTGKAMGGIKMGSGKALNFDGQGYEIKNLSISTGLGYNVALFTQVRANSTIKNLHLVNANVTSGEAGDNQIAAIAAQVHTPFTMENCSVSGSISQIGAANQYGTRAGGLVAVLNYAESGTATFTNCVNTATVSMDSTSAHVALMSAGGIIGQAENKNVVTITNCVNTGAISGYNAGGIVGSMANYAHVIDNCINTGSVEAFTNGKAGAMVGNAPAGLTIKDSYTDVAGLALAGAAVTSTNSYTAAELANNQTAVDAINAKLYTPDTSTAGGKLSIRMKLTDDFGFMAVLNTGALMNVASEYGFCFATEEFDNVADATKVAGAKYNGSNGFMQSAYTNLTAATLDTTVYFAAYATVNGVTYMSQVREINCLDVVEDLADDGKLGETLITENAKEKAVYAQMVVYHNAYKGYLDSVQ